MGSAVIARLREATSLLAQMADLRSRRELLRVYAVALRDPPSNRVADLRLRCAGRELAVHMRCGDLFTLGEVFHERQYAPAAALPDSPTILDAGANIGLASLWLLAHHPRARIVCFEPEPGNLEYLARNMAPFEGAEIEAAALGRDGGTSVLHLGTHPALHSTHAAIRDGGSVRVTRVALGPYLRQRGIERVDLLKLDVEGAEDEVIEGCDRELRRIDRIVGELHVERVPPAVFYGRLQDAGFVVDVRRLPAATAGERVELFAAVHARVRGHAAMPLSAGR